MNKNQWLDLWMMLPQGQRRILLLLVCVIVLLCVVRGVAALQRSDEPTADYSALEQEITDFRSQLDTIPLDERRPVYERRTDARRDTTIAAKQAARQARKKAKQQREPRPIESMQRVGDVEN